MPRAVPDAMPPSNQQAPIGSAVEPGAIANSTNI
jgi:hypothetical protein